MKRLILMIVILKLIPIQSILAKGEEIPYYKSKGIIQSEEVRNSNLYTQFDILIDETDPRTKASIKVKAHYFKNKKHGRLPLLIIVPPINGVGLREKSVTKHFIGQGYSTLIIEPVKNISDSSVSVSEFENNLLSFVGAVRSAVDVMVEKPEVDSNNVFIWASSMGAIYSSIVIGLDKRINSGIIILGGGSIPDIVTDSKQKYIVRYKRERMIKENLTEDAFRLKMKEAIKIDPLHYAKLRSSSEIFFIMANKDTSVPSKYQHALYESFGSPEHCKKYNGGHVGALIRSHLFKLKIYSDFTNSRFKKSVMRNRK
jgi:hypothetical protein